MLMLLRALKNFLIEIQTACSKMFTFSKLPSAYTSVTTLCSFSLSILSIVTNAKFYLKLSVAISISSTYSSVFR